MMKIVYIACPYTLGDVAVNVRNSFEMAEQLANLEFLTFNPLQSHFQHMVFPHTWDYWMDLDLNWLRKCDCLLRLSGESKGADREVAFALDNNIPVYYTVKELLRKER